MFRLINIEFKKMLTYKTFWVLMGFFIFALSLSLGLSQLIINKIVVEAGKNAPIPIMKISIFYFPKIWHHITYFAGYFNLFLAVIIIFFVCNEFSFKTIRQNIVNGMSRNEFVISKLYFIIVLSLGITLVLFILGLILGLIHTRNPEAGDIFGAKLQFLLGYFIELITYLTFAFFIAFLIRRAALAIVTLLFYTAIEQIIIWWQIPTEYVKFMPLKAFGRLVHFPSIPLPEINGQGLRFQDYVAIPDSGIAILYALIFLGLILLIMKKRDL